MPKYLVIVGTMTYREYAVEAPSLDAARKLSLDDIQSSGEELGRSEDLPEISDVSLMSEGDADADN
jgi:hypothetical protein